MNTKIKLGMVQINNSFSNQNYLPYSIGLLQAYAQKYLSMENKERFEFLPPIYKRIPIKNAEEKLSDTGIVFFSTYTWNSKISLEIAKRIKSNSPETLIVFGGPHVPEKNIEDFLKKNSFIDIACRGEGENAFVLILDNYSQGNWQKIPSITYIDSKGKCIQNPIGERIRELDKVVSPYTSGVFDSLMELNPQEQWIALLETNRGCPFLCSYCVWGASKQNNIYTHNLDKIYNEIDWFSRKKIEFIFCCDANFGILDRDMLIVERVAENKQRFGYPKVFSVQSTKNFTEHTYKIYKKMSEAGLSKGVSLSLQSLNEETLRDTRRRNISTEVFKETQQRLTAFNIKTFTDLILGLPNETYESFVSGVSSIIENGQHNRIQFNNLSILPNSEMDDLEYQKRYGFNIVETKLINIHGSLFVKEEIQETQQLIVGTKTMPKIDWGRCRTFGWMTSLLHFDKLLQVSFIILNKVCSLSYRELIEAFTDKDRVSSLLSQILSFFMEKAIDIQNGGSEFCESKKWLNIWWPVDELILINLCTENRLNEFYDQAEKLMVKLLQDRKLDEWLPILQESIRLNKNLIKLPFQEKDIDIRLSYNIWDVYYAALRGIELPFEKDGYSYRIERSNQKWLSWEDWCREVIWYGNKKGAYIYNCKPIDIVAEDKMESVKR